MFYASRRESVNMNSTDMCIYKHIIFKWLTFDSMVPKYRAHKLIVQISKKSYGKIIITDRKQHCQTHVRTLKTDVINLIITLIHYTCIAKK